MDKWKLAEVEAKFVEIVWENEPVSSGQLVRICGEKLNWKKSTTYTVLRKLCQRRLLQNRDSVVTSLIKRDEYFALQNERFVEENFHGSLPQFLSAFMSRRNLSAKQAAQIERMIKE